MFFLLPIVLCVMLVFLLVLGVDGFVSWLSRGK